MSLSFRTPYLQDHFKVLCVMLYVYCFVVFPKEEPYKSYKLQALQNLGPSLPSASPSLILVLPYWSPWCSSKKLRVLPFQGLCICFFLSLELSSPIFQGLISSLNSELCAKIISTKPFLTTIEKNTLSPSFFMYLLRFISAHGIYHYLEFTMYLFGNFVVCLPYYGASFTRVEIYLAHCWISRT